jgi:hypothetical protein
VEASFVNPSPPSQPKVVAVSTAILNSVLKSSSNSLEARDTTKATMALEMLSGGETWENISNATGYNFDQISRIRARHEMAIEVRKKQLAADGFEMAEGLRLLIKQKMEQLSSNPSALARTNLRDLVLPYGIAVDKGMQAMGENKVVIEHRSNKPSLEDAMKAIEDARRQLQKEAIPVEAVTVHPAV